MDGDDVNLLAMQMQKHQFETAVSPVELWTIWSLVGCKCYDINGKDDQGVPPIVYAAKRGSIVLLRLLLNYRADINAVSKFRETALIVACRRRKMGAVRFLVKRGASLDLVDRSQFSALRWAATHGDVSLVKMLLRCGISVTRDCYTHNSAIEIAMSHDTTQHAKIVLLLQRQLMVERRQLLQGVTKRKEQEEIDAIKRHRRKQRRLEREKKAIERAVSEASVTAAVPRSAGRSPFALPIIPSLKRTRRVVPSDKDHPTSAMAGVQSPNLLSCPTRTNSLRDLLLSQLMASPQKVWVKVGRGTWRQAEPRPRVPGSIVSEDVQLFDTRAFTAVEVLASEAKWSTLMTADSRPLHERKMQAIPVEVETLRVEDLE